MKQFTKLLIPTKKSLFHTTSDLFKNFTVYNNLNYLKQFIIYNNNKQHFHFSNLTTIKKEENKEIILKERINQLNNYFLKCTQCGKCCTGKESLLIEVTKEDIVKISNFLKINVDEFCKEFIYLQKELNGENKYSLKYKKSLHFPNKVECIFLKSNPSSSLQNSLQKEKEETIKEEQKEEEEELKEKEQKNVFSCSIYKVRPNQCRSFPHGWKEEILNDNSWNDMIATCDALEELRNETLFSVFNNNLEEEKSN
ncbi:hypothetical protein ABK040_007534 [Willaertia magna]